LVEKTSLSNLVGHRGLDPLDSLEGLGIPPQGALRHQIMQQLLRAIFQRHLPAGTRLTVLKLAARFGTSSTPVREALVELAGIGVVDFIHNRGAVVAPFGPKELQEIYQIRRVLEAEAARSACGKIPLPQLENLQKELKELLEHRKTAQWAQRGMALDRRLHELIASSCGSQRLAKEIRRYDILVQTIREIIGPMPAVQQKALEEHLRIIDALIAGEAEKAAQAMADHIQSAAQVCQEAMFAEK
jgi:DNA-binding GntR family transcriptional regulator